jgi:hypothetical protein
MNCSNCKKKQQKTIAELFNINDSNFDMSKKATHINKIIIDLINKEHNEKRHFMKDINDIFHKMFTTNLANHFQIVSFNTINTFHSTSIDETITYHSIDIKYDTFNFSNMKFHIRISFKYEASLLIITLEDLSYLKKNETKVFNINEKNDFYTFISELSTFLKKQQFKYNIDFDMKSNTLDTIIEHYTFIKIKSHNEKTISKLLDTFSDCEKITNIFLTTNKTQRHLIKNKIYQTMNM